MYLICIYACIPHNGYTHTQLFCWRSIGLVLDEDNATPIGMVWCEEQAKKDSINTRRGGEGGVVVLAVVDHGDVIHYVL